MQIYTYICLCSIYFYGKHRSCFYVNFILKKYYIYYYIFLILFLHIFVFYISYSNTPKINIDIITKEWQKKNKLLLHILLYFQIIVAAQLSLTNYIYASKTGIEKVKKNSLHLSIHRTL